MEGSGMNLMEMWEQMGWVAKLVAYVLFFMSFWSVGVAVERIFTFRQAKTQSKEYAPLVAKHLKAGSLKEAIALSKKDEYKYSHLAKVVTAGSISSSRTLVVDWDVTTCWILYDERFSVHRP